MINDHILNCRSAAINKIVATLNASDSLDSKLRQICTQISFAYDCPGKVSTCIYYDSVRYISRDFTGSQRLERYAFSTPDKVNGVIEVHFPDDYKPESDADFLNRVDDFFPQIARLIVGSVSVDKLAKLIYDNSERIKELTGIQRTAEILRKTFLLNSCCRRYAQSSLRPGSIPESTVVRLVFGKDVFTSKNFQETPWMQKQVFETPDHQQGSIEVFYLKEFSCCL